ncbi:MAG: hypothetical protein ABJH68_15435 [Ilumatobacter sp.]|uniref:hypothetical protein n=1 Tax=Ilumatobacter sp. TaxID=1967498 RepID=UPI0032990B6F
MSGPADDSDLPPWVYLIGVGLILFVIYVWQARLDLVTDLVDERMRDDVRDLQPTMTSKP